MFADGRVEQGSELLPSNPATAQQLDDTWSADASFALDQVEHDARFAGHIAEDRVGIFGHSFGGNVAARVPQRDARFTRAANLDGAFFGESPVVIEKPLLILYAASDTGIDLSFCRANPAKCNAVAFPAARHMNFSDAGILPSRFPLPRALLLLGPVDSAGFLREISDRLQMFFAES
ncbi:MAG TPA: hypothetical protein VG273_14000 [Bryobacteraceae bacterium]|nr:hypothetical protein [Bryobacteraceae bacterium]